MLIGIVCLFLGLIYFELRKIGKYTTGTFSILKAIYSDVRFIEGKISGRHKIKIQMENVLENARKEGVEPPWEWMHDKFRPLTEQYEKLRE